MVAIANELFVQDGAAEWHDGGGTDDAPAGNPVYYASGQGWQAVELPYAASELAMLMIVPQGALMPTDVLSPETRTQVAAGPAAVTSSRSRTSPPRRWW